MTPGNPDPRPTRTFTSGDAADAAADHTRTFSADPSATSSFPISVPTPLTGPISGWPTGLTRYQPLHALGGGGMGLVYLCHDRQLDRQVAVKLPGVGRATPQDRIDFVLREARSAARLHHPNICPVFDADVCDGVPFLTMAYVDGPTLADELKRCGPCPPPAAAKLVRAIAEAMQYAHDQGVVHRDLKPSNILLTPEREPIVTDFGLAIRLDRDTTASGSISGTPHYMAPEQAAGDTANIGERTDIFSLGVILFEALTGRVPFDGSAHEVMAKVQRQPLPAMRKVRKGLPKVLERIVVKATARKPDDRYQTMTEFADALTRFLRPAQPKPQADWGLGKTLVFVGVPSALGVLLAFAVCGLAVLWPAMQKARTKPRPTNVVRAEELYREAMEISKNGHTDEGLAKLDEAVRLDPTGRLPRIIRAVHREAEGRLTDAIEDVTVLLETDPSDKVNFRYRASMREKLRLYKEAESDLTSALSLKQDDPSDYVKRGQLRLRLNRFADAKDDFDRAIESTPKDATAIYLRGVAKRKLGDEPGAAADIVEAMKLDDKIEHKLRAAGHFE